MHKPRRRTKYFERFYFEYEGILYLSKKNCCEKLGFEYGSVLGIDIRIIVLSRRHLIISWKYVSRINLFFAIGIG